MVENQIRVSKLVVNLSNLKHNYLEVKKMLSNGAMIMPIIKANAYGIGLEQAIKTLSELDVKIVGVAITYEAIVLRNSGYTGEIFVLNQPYIEEIETIAKYDITCGVSSLSFIEALGKTNHTFRVHTEIGTGMGRTGIRPSRMQEELDFIKQFPNIVVEGIYTHFACSDCDMEYTQKQIQSFEVALNIMKQNYPDIKYIHACNSAGVLNFPEAHYNLVRPGLILYGYYPDPSMKDKIDLKPVSTLQSKITYIKEVPEGTNISYGRKFMTTRYSVIATIPIGYADGVKRQLTNIGGVVINNRIAPMVGTVCMDNIMVDVTDIPEIKVGDDVFLWDNEIITVEDIANQCNTIHYEIVTSISARVRRGYMS